MSESPAPPTAASVAVALVAAITVTEAFAQTCLRTACNERDLNDQQLRCQTLIALGVVAYALIALGVVAYALIAFMLFRVYRYSNLGHTNLVWSCTSIIVAFAVGFALFNEKPNHYTLAAIAFACCAIYLAHKSAEVV